MTLDDLRTARPELGFAVYAMEPGAGVTLEVHTGSDVVTFRGVSEADVLAKAFPPVVSQSPSNGVSHASLSANHDAGPSAGAVGGDAETTSVFD